MKNHVIIFQDRFADGVESGAKPHTIRKLRKHPIKAGDHLSLRKWLGKPYQSKQKILRESECLRVTPFEIDESFPFSGAGNELAVKDGFTNARDMVKWFKDTHGLPFEGVLIEWKI